MNAGWLVLVLYRWICQNHVQESHGGHEGIKEQTEGLEAGIRSDEI